MWQEEKKKKVSSDVSLKVQLKKYNKYEHFPKGKIIGSNFYY